MIFAGHGRAILAMKTRSGMLGLWRKILDRDLSVRGAENIVKAKADSKFTGEKLNLKKKNATVQKLEDEMIAIFGTKVRLNHKGKNGGSIVVNYFSDDDLERILDILRSVD